MEKNQFELLDEAEQDLKVETPQEPQLKEYEKLLILERNRKDLDKAKNLVKFGCFEQKQENTLDFDMLELIPLAKKYRGLYQLYRNVDTMQLLFVCPLVEDNKGDTDERKDLKPYGYDVIYLEVMDNETYQMVSKAAKNNLSNVVSFGYRASFIIYFIYCAFTLAYFIYNLIAALFGAFYYSASYFVGFLVATPILVLLMMKYRKYKAE